MQTFLPYDDFRRTAEVLDDRRLGKQRVEVLQILRALHRPSYGWRNHPAVRMWRGYDEALVSYGAAICREWRARGHADTVLGKLLEEASLRRAPSQDDLRARGRLPPWLGRADIHASHRAALVRKDALWYGDRFPDADPDAPYVWPVASGA